MMMTTEPFPIDAACSPHATKSPNNSNFLELVVSWTYQMQIGLIPVGLLIERWRGFLRRVADTSFEGEIWDRWWCWCCCFFHRQMCWKRLSYYHRWWYFRLRLMYWWHDAWLCCCSLLQPCESWSQRLELEVRVRISSLWWLQGC